MYTITLAKPHQDIQWPIMSYCLWKVGYISTYTLRLLIVLCEANQTHFTTALLVGYFAGHGIV